MFHRSAHDNPRTWQSRRVGYDTQRDAMHAILSHDPAPAVAPPASRASSGGVANALGVANPLGVGGGAPPPEYGQNKGRRHVGGGGGRSEMSQLMHGVAQSSAPARQQPAAASGRAMHTLLYRSEESDANVPVDDPFAHCRGRKQPSNPAPRQPPAVQPMQAAASQYSVVEQYHRQVYDELMEAVRVAPREADGTLSDYMSIIQLLRERGIELSSDGAGTLIATCDVRGGIEFEGFLHCCAVGKEPHANAPPSKPPPQHPPSHPSPSPPHHLAVNGAQAHMPSRPRQQLQMGEYEPQEWQQHTWRSLNMRSPAPTAATVSTEADKLEKILSVREGPNAMHNLSNLINGDPTRFARKGLNDRLHR